MDKRNICLDISYDGRNYNGWQKQKKHSSVQETIESVLIKIFNEKINLVGAGRTDSKAHSIKYTANFKTSNFSIPVNKIKKILNDRLPPDIRILGVKEVDLDFHSRFSAKAREYVYIIYNGKEMLPHFKDYVYHINEQIDIKKLREILKIFCGPHNFKNFCTGYSQNEDKNFERIIYYFRVKNLKILGENFIIFFIKGNGFLQGMIRTLVSVALNYEKGLIEKELIIKALNNETTLENKYKVLVPASGLYFKRAYY